MKIGVERNHDVATTAGCIQDLRILGRRQPEIADVRRTDSGGGEMLNRRARQPLIEEQIHAVGRSSVMRSSRLAAA
jgi:hypothetical protein